MENTELTYQQILNAFDAFSNDLAQAKLGWKLSLYISKNIDALRPHIKHYNEANRELLMEYSNTRENAQGEQERFIPNKDILSFQKEQQELLDTTVDIEYASLNINDLSESEQEKLDSFVDPKIMYGIKYTIQEDE